jgi:hypothetical protein
MEMKKQSKKIKAESERGAVRGLDEEAERLYAADAEAALNEIRPDAQLPWEEVE